MKNVNEIDEMIKRIENAANWSDIEPEEYTEICESLGLDYSSYDDPDEMMADILKARKSL